MIFNKSFGLIVVIGLAVLCSGVFGADPQQADDIHYAQVIEKLTKDEEMDMTTAGDLNAQSILSMFDEYSKDTFVNTEADKRLMLKLIETSQSGDNDSSGDLKRWLRQINRHKALFGATKVLAFIMAMLAFVKTDRFLMYSILWRTSVRILAPQLALAAQLFMNEVYETPFIGPIALFIMFNLQRVLDEKVSQFLCHHIVWLREDPGKPNCNEYPIFSFLTPISLNIYPKAFMMGNDYYSTTSMAADKQSAVSEAYLDFAKEQKVSSNIYNRMMHKADKKYENQQG
eukprot:Nk52_evm6s310 gene=Nk52_evmTU6s310